MDNRFDPGSSVYMEFTDFICVYGGSVQKPEDQVDLRLWVGPSREFDGLVNCPGCIPASLPATAGIDPN